MPKKDGSWFEKKRKTFDFEKDILKILGLEKFHTVSVDLHMELCMEPVVDIGYYSGDGDAIKTMTFTPPYNQWENSQYKKKILADKIADEFVEWINQEPSDGGLHIYMDYMEKVWKEAFKKGRLSIEEEE